MKDLNLTRKLERIFASLDRSTFNLTSRESNVVEFKESFNWGSKDKYAKSIASFSNNRGGFLIFGVTNQPRCLVGLTSNNFENLDEAIITSHLNNLFSPEVHYEKFVWDIAGSKIGVIYTHEGIEKPLVAIKNDGEVKEAEIYYRYNARNEKIKYPELKALFERAKEQERVSWMKLFEKVSKIGPANTGVMNIEEGTIEGQQNSLLIDHSLIAKLKFIKEGQFLETGKPTLKLIGDVRPIAMVPGRMTRAPLRLTSDPSATPIREETIMDDYPLDYYALVKTLEERYSDFKVNQKFYDIKKKLMQVPDFKFSKPRFLDPSKPNGMKKDFYCRDIISEFDQHYTVIKQ